MTPDEKYTIISRVGPAAAALSGVYGDDQLDTYKLTKNLFGRFKTVAPSTDPITFNMMTEVETDFFSVRIAIPNLHTSAVAGVKVSVSVSSENFVEDFATKVDSVNGSPWIDATFKGATSVSLPVALGTDRPSWTYTDIIPIQSVPTTSTTRIKPFLMVRIEYPANSTLTCPYNDIYFWRTIGAHPTLRVAQQNVLGVTTKSSFTQFITSDTNVVVPAFEYNTSVLGKQVVMCGDSTVAGQGSQVRDFGAVQRACVKMSSKSSPIEYFNTAKLGLGPAEYSKGLLDVINEVAPTDVFYSLYSVNDTDVGGLSALQVGRVYGYLGYVNSNIDAHKTNLFLLEGLPCNPTFRDTGAGDSKRRDINLAISKYKFATVVKDYAKVVSGNIDADGQTLIKDGYDSGDGVHFTDAGYDSLSDQITPYFKPYNVA